MLKDGVDPGREDEEVELVYGQGPETQINEEQVIKGQTPVKGPDEELAGEDRD